MASNFAKTPPGLRCCVFTRHSASPLWQRLLFWPASTRAAPRRARHATSEACVRMCAPSVWCPGALFNLNAAPANCHATFHAQCDWLLPRGLFTSLAPISRDCVAPGSAGAESAGTPGECSAMPFPPSLGSSTAAGAGWPNRSKSEARRLAATKRTGAWRSPPPCQGRAPLNPKAEGGLCPPSYGNQPRRLPCAKRLAVLLLALLA